MRTNIVIGIVAILGLGICVGYAEDKALQPHDCNRAHPGQDVSCISVEPEFVPRVNLPNEQDGGIRVPGVAIGIRKTSKHGVAIFVTAAVCDPIKAFAGYEKANVLTDELEKDVKLSKKQVQGMARQIIAKQRELNAFKKKKKGDEYLATFEQLATLKAEYKSFVTTRTTQLNERKDVLLKSGLADVYAAVDEVAKARGLNLVLNQRAENRSAVLYADDAMDITDAVIELLNGGGE